MLEVGDHQMYTTQKMMADIQTAQSRLVAKAGQLIGNFTINLAKYWMHIHTKFDGGKSSIVPRVDHFNTIAWVLAFVSPLVQHGDQPLGEASLAVIPMKPSSKLQRKMRRKFSKAGRENHQMKLKETEGKGNMPNQKMTQ